MATKLTTNQLSCFLSQLQILKHVNFINIPEILPAGHDATGEEFSLKNRTSRS